MQELFGEHHLSLPVYVSFVKYKINMIFEEDLLLCW